MSSYDMKKIVLLSRKSFLAKIQTHIAKIEINKKNEAKISLATPETAVSPGQACVFYCKDEIGTRLLGGGWIHSTNE